MGHLLLCPRNLQLWDTSAILTAKIHVQWLWVTGVARNILHWLKQGELYVSCCRSKILSPNQELDLKPVYLIFQFLYSHSPCIGFPFLHLCIWINNLVWSLQFLLCPSSISPLEDRILELALWLHSWQLQLWIFLSSNISQSFMICNLPRSTIHSTLTNRVDRVDRKFLKKKIT